MFADADVLTGDFPSRVALEEEEEQLQEVAAHYAHPPEVEITHEAGAGVAGCTLLLAVGQGPVAVARQACTTATALGSVLLPRLPSPAHLPLPNNVDRTAQLLLLPAGPPLPAAAGSGGGGGGAGSRVVVALCQDDIPAERSRAWAAAVLGALQPSRVAVLCTMLAQQFVGGAGDPSEDALVFAVESAAAGGAARAAGLAPLPSGNLLGGLPAAVLTQCQLTGRPCAVGCAVQHMPVADAQLARGIAAAGDAMAEAVGVPRGTLRMGSKEAVAGAIKELDAAFVSSAAASMYA